MSMYKPGGDVAGEHVLAGVRGVVSGFPCDVSVSEFGGYGF
jgi:hypothetical protein